MEGMDIKPGMIPDTHSENSKVRAHDLVCDSYGCRINPVPDILDKLVQICRQKEAWFP